MSGGEQGHADQATGQRIIVLHSSREWTCPHCFDLHLLDHDLDDLSNLECRNCERVTLVRVLS